MNARERIAALMRWRQLPRDGHAGRQGPLRRRRPASSDTDPTNAIVGTGRVEGRKVALHVDDFTIRAGSSEGTIADKWIYIERLAWQLRMPLVRLVDSAGGSVKLLMQIGGTKIPEYTTWPANDLLKTVPVVGVALGACAGQGAIKVLSSHFSVLVREQAQVMAAGPHVVRQAYGVEVDKNDLGGWKAHRKSALVHNEARGRGRRAGAGEALPVVPAAQRATSWRRCCPATMTRTAPTTG